LTPPQWSTARWFFAEYFELGRKEQPDGASVPPMTAPTIVGGVHEVVYPHVIDGQTSELAGLLPDPVVNAGAPLRGPRGAGGGVPAPAGAD
jgi:hypothetical protein